ncbi:MAG: UDPGP type 1 family protein [Victivallaceae bacterium]|nr:UDPGP type 1 family protein [Victivallaceae bacterium]
MAIDSKLKSRIAAAGQSHVLKYFDELDEAGRNQLVEQLSKIDFEALPGLVADYVAKRPEIAIPADIAAASYYPVNPSNDDEKALYAKATELGRKMISEGKVACLTVAGGQGTRLGFDGPQGTFPIGPVTGRTLFQYFAEGILRNQEKYGTKLDWFIMTSKLNHESTVAFFREHGFFGLDEAQVFFFTQGTMPAIGYDGKLLMSAKDSLSLSPDGHGGTLLALRRSGALDRMRSKGVEAISYFQVDNPLVPVVDPLFIGLHALTGSQMSAIVLEKTGPYEKLGNFCVTGGRVSIIEYSDLPKEMAERRLPDGSLEFSGGSPAIHVISRGFVEELTEGDSLKLPWHRADKKIPCIDATGNPVAPESPNGVKLESFIFDALPLAKRTMLLARDRAEVFAPTKNRTGVDSVESCRAMLMARDASRLQAAGVSVPMREGGVVDALIEVSPRLVADVDDAVEFARKRNLQSVVRGDKVCFE